VGYGKTQTATRRRADRCEVGGVEKQRVGDGIHSTGGGTCLAEIRRRKFQSQKGFVSEGSKIPSTAPVAGTFVQTGDVRETEKHNEGSLHRSAVRFGQGGPRRGLGREKMVKTPTSTKTREYEEKKFIRGKGAITTGEGGDPSQTSIGGIQVPAGNAPKRAVSGEWTTYGRSRGGGKGGSSERFER